MIAAVHIALAVLAVPQQGAANLRHGNADLVGAARQQTAFHQRQPAPAFESPVKGDGGLAAGHRLVEEPNLLFGLVFQQEALNFSLRLLGPAHGDAKVGLFQLVGPDLLVDDPQGLRVLGGDDDTAGVPVDPVAQRRGKGIFPLGIPFPFLVKICLNVIDEGVDLFRLVSVDGHTGTLVHQQQIFVLVDNIQLWLEHREKEIFLIGLVKELIIDV